MSWGCGPLGEWGALQRWFSGSVAPLGERIAFQRLVLYSSSHHYNLAGRSAQEVGISAEVWADSADVAETFACSRRGSMMRKRRFVEQSLVQSSFVTKTPRRASAALAACFICFLANVVVADSDMEQVAIQTVIETHSNVRAYWTAERMAAAQPMPLPRIARTTGAAVPEAAAPRGPALIAPSGGPGDEPTEYRVSQSALASELQPLAGSFPFVFTAFRAFPNHPFLYKQIPYRHVGKLFFSIPGEGPFVCSGSVVNAPNNSMVWTAGHCVYTPDVGFHTNFLFAPARRQSSNPYATWTVQDIGTLVGWQNGLLEYDHGALAMARGGPGAGNYLIGQGGFLGFAADISRQQHWHVTGYPAEAPFSGEHQFFCATPRAVDDLPTGTGGDPQTIGVGCDMTGGSSGSPWILDWSGNPGQSNFLNGNVSYGYEGSSDELYGPYFGDGAINLRDGIGAVVISP